MPTIRKATSLILSAWLTACVADRACAGPFATAFANGELARAEQIRNQNPAPLDAADQAAACQLLLLENHVPAATSCFQRLLHSSPSDHASLAGLARADFRAGDYAGAAKAFAAAGQAPNAAEATALAAVNAYRLASSGAVFVAPFERTDPLPLLHVRLPDGRTHLFVLDTGAGETILDPALTAAAHVSAISGAASGVFAGGRTAALHFGLLPSLTLGTLTLQNLPVMLLPTGNFTAALGAPVEGVIGVDLLRHFTATIDYPAHRLELALPITTKPQVPDPKLRSAKFWLAGSHYVLAEGAIDGTPELAILDTGLAGQGCTAPASTLSQIQQAPKGKTITGPGGGGETTATMFTARSVSIGALRQAEVACLAGPFPAALEYATGTRIGLLVSHTFLERYAVTFDFAAMTLRFRE